MADTSGHARVIFDGDDRPLRWDAWLTDDDEESGDVVEFDRKTPAGWALGNPDAEQHNFALDDSETPRRLVRRVTGRFDQVYAVERLSDVPVPSGASDGDVVTLDVPAGPYPKARKRFEAPTGGPSDTPNLADVLAEGNDADGAAIENLADPTNDQDAATKKYVDDNAGDGGSQSNIEHVRLEIAFDTPGLVIPASGPAGIEVLTLEPGDWIIGLQGVGNAGGVLVTEPWDGTGTPTLNHVWGEANRGNLPGTPPTPEDQYSGLASEATDSLSTSSSLKTPDELPVMSGDGAIGVAVETVTLYVYVDDIAGGDPGSTQGAALIEVLVARAPT